MLNASPTTEWHIQTIQTVLNVLESDMEHGLQRKEATRRITQYGLNELVERGRKHPLRILWE